jgi:hypothetical protein
MDQEVPIPSSMTTGLFPNSTDGMRTVNPWKVINDLAASGRVGLERTLRWLLVIARSGVAIPISTFSQASGFIRDFEGDFDAYVLLIECATLTSWLYTEGSRELLSLICTIHEKLCPWIVVALETDDRPQLMYVFDFVTQTEPNGRVNSHRFVRFSLAACLLLIGYERDLVAGMKLLEAEEIARLPQR